MLASSFLRGSRLIGLPGRLRGRASDRRNGARPVADRGALAEKKHVRAMFGRRAGRATRFLPTQREPLEILDAMYIDG